MREPIWDKQTAEQLGWVEDGTDVFRLEGDKAPRHIATVRRGRLYALTGEPLNVWLTDLQSTTDASPASVAAFKKL
jgi:hypothetical protein